MLKSKTIKGMPTCILVCLCMCGWVCAIFLMNRMKSQINKKVKVMCDADLLFINCIAKWPGSVHDAFKSKLQKPLRGIILGDSGYMMRDWLFTPLPNLTTRQQRTYNFRHSSARTAVKRAIGVLKRRWHSLRRLRLTPAKACQVITVCVVLHNRARLLKLEVPSDSESDSDLDSESSSEDADSDGEAEQLRSANNPMSEQARFRGFVFGNVF